MRRYIEPGQSVLDIGGGPGRYTAMLAAMGCGVTLAELSPGNVAFARAKAGEMDLTIDARCLDARDLSSLGGRTYDNVLLMGPLYHLTEEDDRVLAMEQALAHLKPGGVLFASFISSYAGILYAMARQPDVIIAQSESTYLRAFLADESCGGDFFTRAYFTKRGEVGPFMGRFPLTRLHFLGCEGLASACEPNLLAQPPEVISAWFDLNEKVCEREDLMAFSEHFLYIGRKFG